MRRLLAFVSTKTKQNGELIDDFCYTLIVIRTLGHILRQILVAKIPISHGGESNPRTSDLESDTLAPYQQAVIKDWYRQA